MSYFGKKFISFVLAVILMMVSVFNLPAVTGFAADFEEMNSSDVFLKQETSITCTLSSAVMLLRRTAIAAGYSDWRDITEKSLQHKGWIDGVGLRWYFTYYGMTVSHGYFSEEEKKQSLLDLLNDYPQGVVIYNGGRQGQNHAVFLCDYDEENDVFYVADPANNAPEGRIKLEDSTIVGETQDDQINNLTAYWFIKEPVVGFVEEEYSADSDYIVPEQNLSELYDPTKDISSFDSTKTDVMGYYVVTDTSDTGAALRNYPSGNSDVYDYYKKGTIFYLTYKGQNNFGALWYKTTAGQYIFSSNVQPFEEYSQEIDEFEKSSSAFTGTYSVAANDRSQPVALRIEPSEGNNIVAYINDGHLLYIVEEGYNSVGAKWYKTEDGYYIKASETEFVSSEKDKTAGFSGTEILIIGKYESKPAGDIAVDSSEAAYYEITASALNVRSSPVDGDVIGTLFKGEFVKVISVSDGWGKIIYNGVAAWISMDYAVKIDINEISASLDDVTLSADKIKSGDKIVCTANVPEGNNYTYKYSLYNVNGNCTPLSEVKNNSYECSVSGAGYYYFRVEVTDILGRSVYGYSGNFLVYDELQIDSIVCSSDGNAFVSDKIVWTVNSGSVSDTAVYNYTLYVDDILTDKISSESNEYIFKPEKTGKYVLKVFLSDEFSNTSEIVADPVTVYPELIIESVKVSKQSVVSGSDVTCAVIASGGIGELKYSFSLYKDGTLIENGALSESVNITVSLSEEGSYKFFCTVTDSSDNHVSGFSDEITVLDQITGDVDSDGKVAANDARLALRYAAALETLDVECVSAADVNNDGKVNASDARLILRYSARIISSFD